MVAYTTIVGSTPRPSQPTMSLLEPGTRFVNRRVEVVKRPRVTR
jgi:hypothetical protein